MIWFYRCGADPAETTDLLDGLQVLHDVHLAVEEPVGRSGSEDLVEAHIDHFTLGAVIGRSGREVLALWRLNK